MSYIYLAMGWILKQIYNLMGAIAPSLANYAIAIVLFTILVNAVFLPLNFQQQKTTAKQTALRPKLDALKKKCGTDKQKYNTEMQALYQRENVKMMAGCLPQLIKLPFLWGVWQAIRSPLSYILNLGTDQITAAKQILIDHALVKEGTQIAAVQELDVVQNMKQTPELFNADVVSQVNRMDFNLFGLDLTKTPKFTFNFSTVTPEALALWLIPLFSFATAMLSSVVMLKMQKVTNPDSGSMGGMMLMMPIISLVIAFTVPAAVGFYWGCSNVVTMLIQVCLNRWYSPYEVIARGELQNIALRRKKEQELKMKRTAAAE